MQRTKRPHYVQRAYLDRFTTDGKVTVRRRDGAIFDTDTVNVAVRAGLYDVRHGSPEHDLSQIEGAALDAVAAIDATGEPPAGGTSGRAALCIYLAMQITRTREERERVLFPKRVAEYAGAREVTRELVAEYLEKVHLGFRARDAEAAGAFTLVSVALREPHTLTDDFAIAMMFRTAEAAMPVLDALYWTVEVDRKGGFITSDTPLVMWRAPSPRDQYEGFGVESAEELRFPLDPGKQLVLSKRRRTPTVRAAAARVRACNEDMAAACHEFVVSPPARRAALERLMLAARRPVLRFNEGPLYEVDAKGNRRRTEKEVLHMWVQRRA